MNKMMKSFATVAFSGVLAVGTMIAPLTASAATLKTTTKSKTYELNVGKKLVAEGKIKWVVIKGNSKAADNINEEIQDKVEDFKENWKDFKKEEKSNYKDNKIFYKDGNSELEYIMDVSASTDDYISILSTDYYYSMGAAHPSTGFEGMTFSTKTGEELDIDDVLGVSEKKAKKMIVNKVKKLYNKDKDAFYEDCIDIVKKKDVDDMEFYIDGKKDQAVVVFQQYEIAPYASGIIEISFNL